MRPYTIPWPLLMYFIFSLVVWVWYQGSEEHKNLIIAMAWLNGAVVGCIITMLCKCVIDIMMNKK